MCVTFYFTLLHYKTSTSEIWIQKPSVSEKTAAVVVNTNGFHLKMSRKLKQTYIIHGFLSSKCPFPSWRCFTSSDRLLRKHYNTERPASTNFRWPNPDFPTQSSVCVNLPQRSEKPPIRHKQTRSHSAAMFHQRLSHQNTPIILPADRITHNTLTVFGFEQLGDIDWPETHQNPSLRLTSSRLTRLLVKLGLFIENPSSVWTHCVLMWGHSLKSEFS